MVVALAPGRCRPCCLAAALEAASSGSEVVGRFCGSMRLGRGISANQACRTARRARAQAGNMSVFRSPLEPFGNRGPAAHLQ